MSENIEPPLPSTVEEFTEQRKAAFSRVKDYRRAGNRLVGFLCSYTPLEIIDAAGAASVALCGTSDEVIPEAEKVLPANICPLIKSTYGFTYSQKCPFTYCSDRIIGETTCDGKKKMYELLNELNRTHLRHLPPYRTLPQTALRLHVPSMRHCSVEPLPLPLPPPFPTPPTSRAAMSALSLSKASLNPPSQDYAMLLCPRSRISKPSKTILPKGSPLTPCLSSAR